MSESYVPTTTARNRNVISRFLSSEGGVIGNQGRLVSYEAEEDRVLLLSYTNEVLAEVTNDGNDVTLFIGHYGEVSNATTNHIRQLGSVLSNTEGKSVNVTDTSPTMGVGARASDSAQFISNYVGSFTGGFSAVEIDAMETVEEALQKRLQQLFR